MVGGEAGVGAGPQHGACGVVEVFGVPGAGGYKRRGCPALAWARSPVVGSRTAWTALASTSGRSRARAMLACSSTWPGSGLYPRSRLHTWPMMDAEATLSPATSPVTSLIRPAAGRRHTSRRRRRLLRSRAGSVPPGPVPGPEAGRPAAGPVAGSRRWRGEPSARTACPSGTTGQDVAVVRSMPRISPAAWFAPIMDPPASQWTIPFGMVSNSSGTVPSDAARSLASASSCPAARSNTCRVPKRGMSS